MNKWIIEKTGWREVDAMRIKNTLGLDLFYYPLQKSYGPYAGVYSISEGRTGMVICNVEGKKNCTVKGLFNTLRERGGPHELSKMADIIKGSIEHNMENIIKKFGEMPSRDKCNGSSSFSDHARK